MSWEGAPVPHGFFAKSIEGLAVEEFIPINKPRPGWRRLFHAFWHKGRVRDGIGEESRSTKHKEYIMSEKPGLNVSVIFEVTNVDGSPYHKTELSYAGVPYYALVYMEKVLVGALAEMNKLGESLVDKDKDK
jgi:hypothetical protein